MLVGLLAGVVGCSRTSPAIAVESSGGHDASADASADAPVADVPERRDAGLPPPVPSPSCRHTEPNADVTVETPEGTLRLRYAWVGQVEACGTSWFRLDDEPFLLERDGLSAAPEPPFVTFGGRVTPSSPRGVHEVEVNVEVEGFAVEGLPGELRLRRYDRPGDDPRSIGAADGWCRCDDDELPPGHCDGDPDRRVVRAELRATGDATRVHGSLTARHCHDGFHAICF